MTTVITPDRKVVELNDDGTWKYAVSSGSVLDHLKTLTIPPAVVQSTKEMFSHVGVRVIETGEAFTCIHLGDRVDFVPGVHEASVDFTARVHLFQLQRLAGYVRRGRLDAVEQFRIACALLTSSAGGRHIMANPLMSSQVLRRIIRGKNLMHVTLVSPAPAEEPDATFTIIFINGQQLIVSGLHGKPLRVLRVPFEQALALQKNLFAGLKAGKAPSKWIKIARWYVEWRKQVEVPL